MEHVPLRLGRIYLNSTMSVLGVDAQVLSQFTCILRVQMVLAGDRMFEYEIVGVSSKFDEISVVGMLEELDVAKTGTGKFTGCPEYPIKNNGEII